MRHWLRPLDDIRAGAVRYGEGDFASPIPVRDRGELGRLLALMHEIDHNGLGHLLQPLRAAARKAHG